MLAKASFVRKDTKDRESQNVLIPTDVPEEQWDVFVAERMLSNFNFRQSDRELRIDYGGERIVSMTVES